MTDTSTQITGETEQVVAGITTYNAATMLWVSAVLTILQGFFALLDDKLVVVTTDYAYGFNTSTWGSIHIVVGMLLAAVAFGLFWGATWARVAAIIMASLSIVSMFMWLPHTPIWSIVTIALDVFIIWAVATWAPGFAIECPHLGSRAVLQQGFDDVAAGRIASGAADHRGTRGPRRRGVRRHRRVTYADT